MRQIMGHFLSHEKNEKQKSANMHFLEKALECRPIQETKIPPIPPKAIRGYEGISLADQILKERKAHGVLIGGLMFSLLKGESLQDLYSHKDVDVLIIDKNNEKIVSQWENGIDWWWSNGFKNAGCPRSVEKNPTIFLKYDVEITNKKLPYGLYLLDGSTFESILQHEAITFFSKYLSHWQKAMAPEIKKIPLPTVTLDDVILKRFLSKDKIGIYKGLGYNNIKSHNNLLINMVTKKEVLDSSNELPIEKEEAAEIILAGLSGVEIKRMLGDYPMERIGSKDIEKKTTIKYAIKLLAIGDFKSAESKFKEVDMKIPKDHVMTYLEMWKKIKPKDALLAIKYLRENYEFSLGECVENLEEISGQYVEIFGDTKESREMLVLLEIFNDQLFEKQKKLKNEIRNKNYKEAVAIAKDISHPEEIKNFAELCLTKNPIDVGIVSNNPFFSKDEAPTYNDTESIFKKPYIVYDFIFSLELLKSLYPEKEIDEMFGNSSRRDNSNQEAYFYIEGKKEKMEQYYGTAEPSDGALLILRKFEELEMRIMEDLNDLDSLDDWRNEKHDFIDSIRFSGGRDRDLDEVKEARKKDDLEIKAIFNRVASELLKRKKYDFVEYIYRVILDNKEMAKKISEIEKELN